MIDVNKLKVGDKIRFVTPEGRYLANYMPLTRGRIYTVTVTSSIEGSINRDELSFMKMNPLIISDNGESCSAWWGTFEYVGEQALKERYKYLLEEG